MGQGGLGNRAVGWGDYGDPGALQRLGGGGGAGEVWEILSWGLV
jgi:hypothetical protein